MTCNRATQLAVMLQRASRRPSSSPISRIAAKTSQYQRRNIAAKGPERSPASSVSTPVTASSGASGIMADEGQLGRHFYLNTALDYWARMEATDVSLQQLVSFGRSIGADPQRKILESANFVREQLPIRIAQRLRDMQGLPFEVMTNPNLEKVYHLYWRAFDRYRKIPTIRDQEGNDDFVASLKIWIEEHHKVIPYLALGVVEVSNYMPPADLEAFMARMLTSGVSRRILGEQHIALTEAIDDPFQFFSSEPSSSSSSHPETIGIIQTHVSLHALIKENITLLTHLFAANAGLSPAEALAQKVVPEIIVDGDVGATIPYLADQLSLILFELLKQAMRAVMRLAPEDRDDIPLRATIVEGPPEDDLIIRISDCGGGVDDLVAKLSSPLSTSPSANASASTSTTEKVEANAATSAAPLALSTGEEDAFSSPFTSYTASPSATSGVTPPAPTSTSLTLTDVFCSFSNVRRRLEVEDQEKCKPYPPTTNPSTPSAPRKASNSQPRSRKRPTPPPLSSATPSDLDSQKRASLIRSTLGSPASTLGLGSHSTLANLRSTDRFAGTVKEQVPPEIWQRVMLKGESLTSDSGPPPSFLEQMSRKGPDSSKVEAEKEGREEGAFRPIPLKETGLGLAHARVYAELFGGKVSFRSLDWHGMDVYLRIPKLDI